MNDYEYDEETLEVFLENQEQLFDEKVAQSPEEAQEFLEECLAVVVDGIGEVREYMDESGMDVSELSDDDIEEAVEVFPLSNDRYLVVLA